MKQPSRLASAFQKALRKPLTLISGLVFLIILFACIFAPLIARQSYTEFHLDNMLAGLSLEHPFGTDVFGRDLFARMLYGGRVTFRITLIAAAVSILGVPLGLFSGYYGRKTDAVLSRIFDALSVLPPLLLIVLAETLLGYGAGYYQYALGLAFMPPLFRLTRTLTMETAGREYIEAARALGTSDSVIIRTHILRSIAPELITQLITTFSDILLYSTLIGYLNMGVKSPTPEWGLMVHELFGFVLYKPHLVIVTSAVISITILSISLFGRGLRDAFANDRRTGQ